MADLQTISKLLKLSDRRVQQLAKDGVLPKASRGEYDSIRCVHGYIDYLKNINGQDGSPHDFLLHRNRLTKAKADLTEMEKAKTQGELIPKSEIRNTWLQLMSLLKSKLLSIPNKAAPYLVTTNNINEAKLILKERIYETLKEIAETNIADEQQSDAGSIEIKPKNTTTTTKVNSKRVGR